MIGVDESFRNWAVKVGRTVSDLDTELSTMHRDVSHYENSRSSYDAPRHDALNLGYVIDPSFTSSDGYDGDTFFYLPSRLTEFEDEEEEEHDFYSDPLCQSPQSTNPYDARNHSFFADHSEVSPIPDLQRITSAPL